MIDYSDKAERRDLRTAYVQQSGLRDMTPMERALYAALEAAEAELKALGTVQWEYGTRWHVPGNPDSFHPEYRHDYVVDYAEDSEEEALKIIEADAEANGTGERRGILLRRPVFDSPWEEVDA
jgi:hypothetical protein